MPVNKCLTIAHIHRQVYRRTYGANEKAPNTTQLLAIDLCQVNAIDHTEMLGKKTGFSADRTVVIELLIVSW